MKIIIFGPPGTGKSVYSQFLVERYSFKHIAMGDLLRREIEGKTKTGIKIGPIVDRGELVPDEITVDLLKKEIEKTEQDNIVLDGFPRDLNQAKKLDYIMSIDIALNIVTSEKSIIKRISLRVICEKCDKVYNLVSLKPKQKDICDDCGGRLVQREDDKLKAIKERLKVYQKNTHPVIDHYKEKGILKEIDGEGSIEEVFKKVVAALGLE